jgi:hypothetical protein
MLTGAAFLVACAVTGNMLAGFAAVAQTLDKVSFATNWIAEAEHGGYPVARGVKRR